MWVFSGDQPKESGAAQRLFSKNARAIDHRCSFKNRANYLVDIFRVILKVGVLDDEDITTGLRKSKSNSGALALINLMPKDANGDERIIEPGRTESGPGKMRGK